MSVQSIPATVSNQSSQEPTRREDVSAAAFLTFGDQSIQSRVRQIKSNLANVTEANSAAAQTTAEEELSELFKGQLDDMLSDVPQEGRLQYLESLISQGSSN
jgi:hypothetical protein